MKELRIFVGVVMFVVGLGFTVMAGKSTAPYPCLQVGITFFCTGLILIFCGKN